MLTPLTVHVRREQVCVVAKIDDVLHQVVLLLLSKLLKFSMSIVNHVFVWSFISFLP